MENGMQGFFMFWDLLWWWLLLLNSEDKIPSGHIKVRAE